MTTQSVYAQPTTLPPNDPSTRTFGPQAAQVQAQARAQPITPENLSDNINATAMGGIQDMRDIGNVLGDDVREHNLTKTFNDVMYAFAYIQLNATALERYMNTTIEHSQETITQLQRDLTIARGTLTTTQQQLATTRTELNEANDEVESLTAQLATAQATLEDDDTEPETESDTNIDTDTSETSPELGTNNNDDTLRDLVNGNSESDSGDRPRTDPEGDGGFPSDVDGE